MSHCPSPLLFKNWARWTKRPQTPDSVHVHAYMYTHASSGTNALHILGIFFQLQLLKLAALCSLKTLACLDHNHHNKHYSNSELIMWLAVVCWERKFHADRHHVQKEVYESSFLPQWGKSLKSAKLLGHTSSNYTQYDLLMAQWYFNDT